MRTQSIYKDIVKSTSTYSIAIVAGKMASFLLLPLYTRYLTPADYGVMELLELTSFIFSSLIGMRIGDSLFYYYAKASTAHEKRQTVCTVFLGSVLLSAIGGTIGSCGAPGLSRLIFGSGEYVFYFHLVFASFFFSLPLELGFCYMRALNRPRAYVAASVCRLGIAVFMNVLLLVVFQMGIAGVLWSTLASTAVMALYMVRVVLSDVHIRRDFDFGLLRSFIRYSAPLGISSLGIFAINYGDRFFLQRNVSMTELGLYSLAYKIGMLITYIQMPLDVYWRSQVFSIVRTPDGEKIYVRVCTYLTLALTGVVLLMFLFARPILHVMAAPAFEGAALYVPWIALAYVIRTVGGHFRCAFLLEGKTMKDFGVTTAGAVACVAGYALLIPPLKVWGAIASTVLGFAVMFVLGLWQAQRLRYFPFEYRRMAQLAALALVIGLTFAFFKPASVWMHAGVAVLFAGAYPLLLILVPFLYHEEVQAVRQALTTATRRFGIGPLAGQRASQ